jgi:phosphohistidine swiveling domain-containing protein
MPSWLPILRRRGCPVLFYSYIIHGYKDAYHQEVLGIPQGINYHQYVDGWVIIDLVESETFQKTFSERIGQEGYMRFFLDRCRSVSDDLFEFGAQRRDKSYAESGASELLLDLMTFSSLSIRAMPFLTTMVLLQDVIEKRLRAILARAWDLPEDSEEVDVRMQELLLESGEVPLATLSVRSLRDLAHEVATHQPALAERMAAGELPSGEELEAASPELAEKVRAYLESFDFLGTDYYVGEPLSHAKVMEQLATILDQQKSEDRGEPHHDVSVPSGLGAEDEELIETARELHFLRQHRIEAMFKAGRDVRHLLAEIGQRVGLGYTEVLALTFQELQESLTKGEPSVPLPKVAERMRDYGILIEAGEAQIVVGEELAALRQTLPNSAAGDQLTGMTAFPGSCEAEARVVDRLQDIGTVEAGDVLVAPMTSPYHVPAMTIASAVVTDEGGILSHAAIVSRELKIPCIVGVTGATEAIQSGSRIRVDAQPAVGTVEILGQA